MEEAIKKFVSGFKLYWGEEFETRTDSIDCALARALYIPTQHMQKTATKEMVIEYLKFWDYVWGNKKGGSAHPKWWDSRVAILRGYARKEIT